MFRLSSSTLHKLKSEKIPINVTDSDEFKKIEEEEATMLDIKEKIGRIISPPRQPLTVTGIWKAYNTNAAQGFSKSRMKRFLKEKMKYSYRTSWPRPPKVLNKQKILVKVKFWWEMLNFLKSGKLIINLGESSFDRSLTKRRTWVPTKGSKIMISGTPRGKMNLILATGSDGSWVAMIAGKTLSSKHFWIFVQVLNRLVHSAYPDGEREVIFTADNAPTHVSLSSSLLLEDMKYEMKFLPSYWPEVAPVEKIFGAAKSRMKSIDDTSTQNYEAAAAAKRIAQILQSFTPKTWIGAWRGVANEWKKTIINYLAGWENN